MVGDMTILEGTSGSLAAIGTTAAATTGAGITIGITVGTNAIGITVGTEAIIAAGTIGTAIKGSRAGE